MTSFDKLRVCFTPRGERSNLIICTNKEAHVVLARLADRIHTLETRLIEFFAII